VITRDGAVRWIHSVGQRVLDATGRASWHGISVDLTAHVSADDAGSFRPVIGDAEASDPA
jgi:hypothetical protein